MILSLLQSRLATRYRDPNNEIVTAATWLDYLNDGYRQVASASPYWPWLEGSASLSAYAVGTNAKDLPLDCWRLTEVFNVTDTINMVRLTGRDAEKDLFPQGALSPGIPSNYRLLGRSLEIYPYPAVSTVVRVEYWGPMTLLAAAGDSPVFPEQYHHGLMEWALAQAYLDDGNAKQYDSHMAMFLTTLDNMKNDLLLSRGAKYPQIQEFVL